MTKRVAQTSMFAYFEALPSLPEREQLVLEILRERGPMTCTELAAASGVILDNVRPTVTHLKDRNLVGKTKDRRPTRYGKPSIVWQATDGAARACEPPPTASRSGSA